ncbi:MAG TPA: type II toxin-antitoxin system HicB family antitoxin [Ilumatobacter sp.]|nr:type II toxin-antitoxin system HicB family antitoxin [Ilumatobacter sp.]
MQLTAAIVQEGEWFVARCLEVDVVSQGETLEVARANLIEALEFYFEDEPGIAVGVSPVIVPLDIAV